MTSLTEPFLAEDVPSRWEIHAHDCLGSTSDEALRLAQGGARHGTTVWARSQTAGRGRRGRGWSSPAGNLHMSLVLRDLGHPVAQLSFVASLAVADAVDGICGQKRTRLKWPNDVLLDGGKLAGILLEVGNTPSGDVLVLGIGVNLRHSPDDAAYAATSLHSHGVDATSEAMLAAVLDALGDRLDQWCDHGFGVIVEDWLVRGHQVGEKLRVNTTVDLLEAVFVGLDRDGSLLAQANGIIQRFRAADVLPG